VIYQNQKQQYDLGSLLYSDLLDTDRSLNHTEQNYVKSVYDYLVAIINYQKALVNINQHPIKNTTPPEQLDLCPMFDANDWLTKMVKLYKP